MLPFEAIWLLPKVSYLTTVISVHQHSYRGESTAHQTKGAFPFSEVMVCKLKHRSAP